MQKKLLTFVVLDFVLFALLIYVLGFGMVDERSIYLAVLLGIGSLYCSFQAFKLIRQINKPQ